MYRIGISYLLGAFLLIGLADLAESFALVNSENGYDSPPCLFNGYAINENQIWYVGNKKWQCVRDGYGLRSKLVGCRSTDQDLNIHESKELEDGKFQTCTAHGELVTLTEKTCQDSDGTSRQIGEIWESPVSKHRLRLRFTCEAIRNREVPSVKTLGCIVKSGSSIFVPFGQTVRVGKRYFFCGTKASEGVEVPYAFSYCLFGGKKIDLLATVDQDGVRYQCRYNQKTKATLVPIACVHEKIAYHLGQIRVDSKGVRHRCARSDKHALGWIALAGDAKLPPPRPGISKPASAAKFQACSDFDDSCRLLSSFCKIKTPKPSPCCTNATVPLNSPRAGLASIPLDDQIRQATSEFRKSFSAVYSDEETENTCDCPTMPCCGGKCTNCNDYYTVQYFVTLVQVLCPKTCGTCKQQG